MSVEMLSYTAGGTSSSRELKRQARGSYSKVNSGSAGVNTGNTPVSTPSVVQTVNVTIPSPVKVQREGKAPMTTEDDEEATRQVHLDALLAKRIQEEQELSEQQQKIKAQLKEEFEKLVRSIESFVPKDSEIEKTRVKRTDIEIQIDTSKKQKIVVEDVPITEEKVEVVNKEVPIKKRGKRKKQIARKGIYVDKTAQYETKEEREAHMKDKVTDSSSGSDIGIDVIPTATKPPSVVDWKIIPQPGQKAVYQIIRRDGSDKDYMSFGAILKDLSRDDLIELYRLVIKKYGANSPEEMYDRVLWGDLKTMFDPPLIHCLTLDASTIYMLADRIYHLSKDACQAMINMKLKGGTKDAVCYQLLKMIEKQAGIRWSGI
ncbi:hypothetical protein Tco_1099158 [Tanacetum coccineum]